MMLDSHWTSEQQRWAGYYSDHLPSQLRRVATFVKTRRDAPDTLRPHFESCLALLEATAGRNELARLWLDLVDAIHPLPLRWGFWSPWLDVLDKAAGKATALDRPALHARYLAYTAALLLETAQANAALEKALEGLQAAGRAGDRYALGLAGSRVVGALITLGRDGEAREALAEVRRQLDAAPDNPQEVSIRALLDMEEMDLARQDGQPAKAIGIGERLVTALESTPGIDPHELATALRRRATILWAAGQYTTAAADLIRSAELFRQTGDPLAAVFSEGNLGFVYLSIGRLDLAEETKVRAVRAAEELNAGWWLVRDLGELSGIYMCRRQLETALIYCRRHVEMAKLHNDERQLALARDNRGVTLMLLGRYEEARPDIEAALAYFQRQGSVESIIAATIDMTLYLRSVNETASAAMLAEGNFTRARQFDNPILHMLTSRCLALFRTSDEQVHLLQEALALARKYRRKMDIAGCLFSLSAITGDAAERDQFYDQAVLMMREMGAEAWLAGHSRGNPPFLPMIF